VNTGLTTPIPDFLQMTAAEIRIGLVFKGEETEEKGWLAGVDEALFCRKMREAAIRTRRRHHLLFGP
jgi:hypothetical protein